jgi:hypothetical protein
MASGHMNRVNRPDTWLHRPMLQNVKKALANPEPSTHDPSRKSGCQTPRKRRNAQDLIWPGRSAVNFEPTICNVLIRL